MPHPANSIFPTGKSARSQRGVALVLVLWMLMLMTLVANGVAMTARSEAQIAANTLGLARAEAIADGAIHMAIANLLAPIEVQGKWKSHGLERIWGFDSAEVRITVRNENAKISLNNAPPAMLAGLFRAVGVTAEDAESIAAAILDWRDADNLRSLHGAERDDYVAAGKTYAPANARFESVDELRLVLGITPSIFRTVSSYVTVESESNVVNVSTAERTVLLALPSATAEAVDDYLARRRAALEQDLPPPPLALPGGTAGSGSNYFSILAETKLGDNTRFVREAVVYITGIPANPFVILSWRAPSSNRATPSADPSTS